MGERFWLGERVQRLGGRSIVALMSKRVRITDVSPRDGLQNEAGVIATADKVRLIELLCATGVGEIEVTSFVSPKWVPQLGDARAVFEGLSRVDVSEAAVLFSALVPNEAGMAAAEEVHRTPSLLEKVSVFTAASETFCRKNINSTIGESLARFEPVVQRAGAACGGALMVRGYISCVIACPFEGPIAPERVVEVAERLAAMGIPEIDLGDTIGSATPESLRRLLEHFGERLGMGGEPPALTLHLHDTFGRAAECVKTALEMGVRSFDGSVAGLGGCPYASTPGKRAPGNIDTGLLVRTIEDAGYETGVDLGRLEVAAEFARGIVAKARAGAAG